MLHKRLGFFLALAIVLFVGAWLTVRWMFPPFTPPMLPKPNGYDDLLRAAKMLAPRTGYYEDMEDEELAAIVEQNGPALELARKALQKECMVALDWEQADLEMHMTKNQCMRELARAFAASGQHLTNNGQTDKAIAQGLTALELANVTARGGLILDRMVALPVRYHGLKILRNQIDNLSHDTCDKLRTQLEHLQLQLEPIDEVLIRDREFVLQSSGFFEDFIIAKAAKAEAQRTKTHTKKSEKRWAVYDTLLQTHLGLRAFQLDQNQFPKTLDKLVPKYLDAVPQDPFAGGPLVYHLQDDGYQLYSVDEDGIDHDGVETPDGKNSDLLLDADP